ncbi:MAG: family 16 glycoside hydrolase [Limisphaerales bacterium]
MKNSCVFWMMAWLLGLPAILAGCVLSAHAAVGGNPERTKELVAILQSEAPLFEKARACQQLGEIGTREAVPALAKLLSDEHLSAYARSGLEGIPDASAAAALRTALGTVKGSLLAGVINSLGVLRDAQAVAALRPLAEDPASGVAKEALLALGRIANGESIQILRQALIAGPEAARADAAAACLLAAEKQLADRHAAMAVMLNDAVRTASVSAVYRAAATRGAILARQPDGVAFLMGQLRAKDPVVRKAALLTIREMPGPALADALNAELNGARPELELQLLSALADCHNAQSIQLLEAKATGADPEIRRIALRVLASIAGPSQAGFLLKVLMENRSPAESAIAGSSLECLEGTAVDDLVLEALLSAREAPPRVQLIRLLEARGATNAVPELLRQAADPDEAVSLVALAALKTLAGAREVPALIALTKACKTEQARDAAEKAIVGAATSTGNAEVAGAAVLAELARSAEPAEKNAWVSILISLGYAKALPALEAAMKDPNEAVAANAIENLGRWPDPSPVEALLTVVDTGATPRSRQRALASVIQLAMVAADERQRPDAVVVHWLARASPAAHSPAERRRLISVLGRLKRPESFRLLLPWLDQPDLQTEAGLAIVQIAPALVDSEDSAALKGALETIAATAKNPDIRGQAVKVAQSIRGKGAPVSIFDGQSLAGWEGNTNVWRVRDGLIVGGSMDGNPRNEFLATTRTYTNFVLRLEYKLVGTEGFINSGVQFRSVRLQQPANEMCGFQADIGAGHSGCLYDESRRNTFLARPADAQITRLEKPGEWNRYQVRCDGPRIQITLNGEQTVDYAETNATLPQDGLIGLQIHGGCKAEVSFRNLTIETLP